VWGLPARGPAGGGSALSRVERGTVMGINGDGATRRGLALHESNSRLEMLLCLIRAWFEICSANKNQR
jgi:hypothetical protein